MAVFDANVDSQMKRYIETLSSTITRLTKAVETNESKMIQTESNYIHLLRKTTELENENKDLRKNLASNQDKINQLENSLHQIRRSFEENESRLNRRILDSEGEIKELSRRIDRTGQAELEGKAVGNAEIQLMQARVTSLSEELRMTVENSKRWNDSERERVVRDINDSIRDISGKTEGRIKEIKDFIHQLESSIRVELDMNERGVKRCDDKIKQIIDRVKSNESKYREKHNTHKADISQVQSELETNLETITGTVENLTQVLNGKIALAERQFKSEIASLKKLVVLADN